MLVLTILILVPDIKNKKAIKIPCIYYLIWIYQDNSQTLFNSGSKVNAINIYYT